MTYKTHSQFGREATPLSLKILIFITICTSLAGAFLPALQSLFALSLKGIAQFSLWQLLTYAFLPPSGISFGLFLHLAFNLYLLWTFGASLLLRSKTLSFFALYFGGALFGGLAALLPMALFHFPPQFAGSSPPLYAVLVAWMMLNPESELLLFFSLPVKAAWLILGLLGANLILDLTSGDWTNFLSYLASALFGYLFTLIVWRASGPFLFLRKFEKMVFRVLSRVKEKKSSPPLYRHSKIYDIHSGEPLLNEDQFMDAMLDRISLYGEDSLSPEEKKRMQSISKKKASPKK